MPQKVGPLIEFSNQSDKPLVALVVGAGGGIGSAVARGFRDNGVEVAHADQEGADREERPQSKETADLAWFNIDACNEASVGRLVEAVVERFGRLDFLVNAAGIAHVAYTLRGDAPMPLPEVPLDTVDEDVAEDV